MKKTPMEQLIQYMWDNDMDLLLTTPFKQKINELLNEERELLKSFYLKGDSNGCGCYDYSTDKDAEDYFNENFPARYS
jgi:hypothetical protein